MMRWLNIFRPPCALHCVYCDTSDRFRHVKSYEHDDETLSLYECSTCASLIYDLTDIEAPTVSQSDIIGVDAWRSARYVVEAGFSSHHVALCALAALSGVAGDELRDYAFVDVGAGLGFASQLVRSLYNMPTVTVEPSYTGKISHELLGLEVHRAYFEHLPEALLAELAEKPSCLHLNSVVEHLVDPYPVLRDMVDRVKVEVLAVVVPDGPALDLDGPFLNILPFLAPRDHRHLPSKQGLEALMKRLDFAHVHVRRADGLITAVAAREPFTFPDERTTKLAERLFLEQLLRHPNSLVASGGASRLLSVAVLRADAALMALLRERLPYERDAEVLLGKIRDKDWDDLPFHLGPSCYWLAADAMAAGRLPGALSLLDVTVAFADIIAADYPQLALGALEFKWAGLLLKSHILEAQEDHAGAEAAVRTTLDSCSDAKMGARALHLQQAEARLEALTTKARAA